MKNTRIVISVLAMVCTGCVLSCRYTTPKAAQTDTFRSFPTGETRTVSFAGVLSNLQDLSPRNRQEQMRDWLLYTVVSSTARSAQEVSRMMYDLPPFRGDYFGLTVNLPAGPMRIAYLGNGEAIVLVPEESEPTRLDEMGEAADAYRTDFGKKLSRLHVFEYGFPPGNFPLASLRYLGPFDGSMLYSDVTGYQERVIRDLGDLEAFAQTTSDLTYAALGPDGVRLGARKLRDAAGIGPTEIAELYQADRRYRDGQVQIDRAIQKLNSDWKEIQYSSPEEKARLDADYKRAKANVEHEVYAIQASLGPRPKSCGFSLDPYPEGAKRYRFQKATYICDLRGTETGMVLFYTDLLAKLWAIDFQSSFPRHIAEFTPMTEVKVSSLYRDEIAHLPHTRIWFAPLRRGFQASSSELFFSHTATRVFALSRASGSDAPEVPPNAASASFMNWWNSHYEEIAHWEPRYHELNEIMKWSLVVGWLEARQAVQKLAFLDDVQLTRFGWFPDWVRKKQDLRFNRWDHVGFHPRDDASGFAETMDIISSAPFRFFNKMEILSGGVSLGSSSAFRRESKQLPDSLMSADRRAGIKADMAGYPARIAMEDETSYQFENAGDQATVLATLPPGVEPHGSEIAFSDNNVLLVFTRRKPNLEVEMRAGAAGSAGIRIEERANGFCIARTGFSCFKPVL